VEGNESSRERKFHGTFVPGSESSRERKFQRTKVPWNFLPGSERSTLWNFRSRERKFFGTKVPAFSSLTLEYVCIHPCNIFLDPEGRFQNANTVVVVVVISSLRVQKSLKLP